MSERGSFCTEYIYCKGCLEVIKNVLLDKRKYLWSQQLDNLPIIAGKIGGTWSGEELFNMEDHFIPSLELSVCHPVRISVISDSGGERFFVADPNHKLEESS